jgi:hypothetical protein
MNYLESVAKRVQEQIAPNLRPKTRDEELYRVYALLALVRGRQCTLENVHDAWSAWMTGDQPDHDALVPFNLLSQEAQLKDAPYLAAIQRVATHLSRGPIEAPDRRQ